VEVVLTNAEIKRLVKIATRAVRNNVRFFRDDLGTSTSYLEARRLTLAVAPGRDGGADWLAGDAEDTLVGVRNLVELFAVRRALKKLPPLKKLRR